MAAHSFLPLEALASASFGLVLGMAGHAVGWPLPRGGSQAIAEALAGYLRELGGTIELDRRVSLISKQLPRARAVLLDVTPWQFVRMAGARLPSSYRSRLERFSTRPAFSKWIMRSPLRFHGRPKHVVGLEPSMWVEVWTKSPAGEREVAQGKHPEHPFVLVAQQSLFDQTRAPNGQQTLWAYCHVPARFNLSI